MSSRGRLFVQGLRAAQGWFLRWKVACGSGMDGVGLSCRRAEEGWGQGAG